jgi:hemoglobin
MQTVYEAAGGDDFFLALAEAWHTRATADEVVGHAFSHGFPEHTRRLAAYWAEALGGPTTYSDSYGDETLVVRMHSGNGPHEDMDRRAIDCFDQALTDVRLTDDNRLRKVLHDAACRISRAVVSHRRLGYGSPSLRAIRMARSMAT